MRRRQFITLLGGAVAWPLAARAQQPAMPVVGVLSAEWPDQFTDRLRVFRDGLRETGYVEGRNLAIEYRWAEGQNDRLPALAADLVARRAAVIAATGSTKPVLAAKAATGTIPIVFTYGGDPVEAGFVASLNRPGGNITGVTIFSNVLTTKIVGLLHEIVPQATVIALLLNPEDPLIAASMQRDAQEAVRAFGQQLLPLNASTPSEIELALATLRSRADALVIGGNPFFGARRQQIIALTIRDTIPVAATAREFIEEGALMTYGNDTTDMYHRAGLYAGRILKGEKPAGLPVDQATRFELKINLKTAKRLGLRIPSGIFSIADEVIE
jgi:putative tryptophan/tyrosine transport system substrate-binding protein